MSDNDPAARATWMSWMRDRIAEWEPVDKDVLISRCEDRVPPGYAWQRWMTDTVRDGVEPEPTRENMMKARRGLVLWLLRQLRRADWLVEKNGLVSINKHRTPGKKKVS